MAEPRADAPLTIMRWLRLNLVVLVALSSLVTAIGSAIIAATLRVGAVSHDIASLQSHEADAKAAMSQFHTDMISVDGRINRDGSAIAETARVCESRAAALEQRIAVLEAQLRFFADRLAPPAIGARR